MTIDWSVPQPSYEDLHAQIDALATERNAAVAEARLWLRRLQAMQAERDQWQADAIAADKSHKEWESAYADLLQQLRKCEVHCQHLAFDVEQANAAVRLTEGAHAA